MSSLKLLHSGGNGVIISAPSSNPAANRTITLNDNYAGDGSFVTANSSGNVGIGTASPDHKLQIDDSAFTQLYLKGTGNVAGVRFGNTSYTNGHIYYDNGANMNFHTNGSERMRINSSGNMGYNNTAPSFTSGTGIHLGDNTYIGFGAGGDSRPDFQLGSLDGGTLNLRCGFGADTTDFKFDTSGLIFHRTDSNPTTNATGLYNAVVPSGNDGINIKHLHGGNCVNLWRAAGDGQLVNFYRGNSSQTGVGSITVNSSSTSYNTSSDYRLKENKVTLSDGITRLKTLKPYRFNFKNNPSITVDGFYAHEVTAVPEAITGTKDETEDILYTKEDTIPSGKKVGDVKETVPKYQGIDQSKLVPLLTAALQEAVAKIEVLETKVAALEGA